MRRAGGTRAGHTERRTRARRSCGGAGTGGRSGRGSDGVVLSLDGQTGYTMEVGDRIQIRKSSTTFNLIQPANRNYFDVLRDKLKWGR